jgi:glycosyltransferase involved in cell wall biosynthesis
VEDVVRDGATGFLVKPDPRAFAEALIGLLLDPARRRRMAEHAREVAERQFDADRQVQRIVALYARLLGGAGV